MNNKELYKEGFVEYLKREGSSKREILLGNIIIATQTENLVKINDFLDLKNVNPDNELLEMMEVIGLIKVKKDKEKGNKILFTNNGNVAQYFPAYCRNKEYWDSII